MIQTTVLHPKHLEAGAKMVDFHGWEMPINYGSQLEEHHQVRTDAGMFDVSHMTIVDLTGERVKAFLQHLLANDVAKLTVFGKALYSGMLTPEGGVIDDLITYYLGETFYRLVVNSATREKDLAWIRHHAQDFGVTVTERPELAMIAVQGPNAKAKAAKVFSAEQNAAVEGMKPFFGVQAGELFIATTGYTGEDGYGSWCRKSRRAICGRRCWTTAWPLRPGCPRHPAPRGRHEPLRPGHGRNRLSPCRQHGLDHCLGTERSPVHQ